MLKTTFFTSKPGSPVRPQIALLSKISTFVKYNHWSRALKVILYDNKLRDSDKDAPYSKSAEDKNKRNVKETKTISVEEDEKISYYIFQYIDEEFKNEFGKKFGSVSISSENAARREFNSLKKGLLDIDTLASKVDTLANTASICLGVKIPVAERIKSLLAALPVEYAHDARFIMRDMPERLYEIVPILKETETILARHVPPVSQRPTSQQPRPYQPANRQHFTRNKQTAPRRTEEKKVCRYHPHATNHTTEECSMNATLARLNLTVVERELVTQTDKNYIFTLPSSSLGYSEQILNDWVMDSGASFHLTPNIHEINKFIPLSNEFVILPNGTRIQISGKGNVVLDVFVNGKSTLFVQNDVRCIPELKMRMLFPRPS